MKGGEEKGGDNGRKKKNVKSASVSNVMSGQPRLIRNLKTKVEKKRKEKRREKEEGRREIK